MYCISYTIQDIQYILLSAGGSSNIVFRVQFASLV